MSVRRCAVIAALALLSLTVSSRAERASAPAIGTWQAVPLARSVLAADPVFAARRDSFAVSELDRSSMEALLASAPLRGSAPSAALPVIELPRPDGSLARYRVESSPTLDARLSARFPEISSYALTGEEGAIGRMTRTPWGVSALLHEDGRFLRVQPLIAGGARRHVSFVEADFLDGLDHVCGVSGDVVDTFALPAHARPQAFIPSGDTLRTYRLAVATTGEFFAARGGNNTDVLAAITVDIDRLNLILGMEVAIAFTIIDETTDVFYSDSTTDPYSDGDPCTMRGEAQADILAVIGGDNFDIGHVFGAIPAGGCAGGSNVCSDAKANGASTLRTDMSHPPGHEDFGGYRLVMHEMGHQFGAGHTWNAVNEGNCTNGQYSASTAYEPSSGSTVMSYSGTCGTQDIQGGVADAYYHTFSYDQITGFTTGGAGDTCPIATASGNSAPVVDAGPDYTIPRGTPFTLTGSANDPDGDALTYTWEQVDLAAGRLSANFDDGVGPLFRSFPPVANGNERTLPRLSDILGNTISVGETLPTTDRTVTFRLTARDNQPVGGVDYDTMTVTTDGSAFRVTDPNGSDVLQAGCDATVEWIVGSGDQNADMVDILLSENGGLSFPTLLATVPIDAAAAEVAIPCVVTTLARIKVQAVDNIFFDISSGDFEIVAQPPTISLMASGGAVDGACERLVEFSATVTDDCGLFAADVSSSVDVIGGSATLGVPDLVVNQDGFDSISVSGSVLVSSLSACPAQVRVTIDASDGCGYLAAEEIVVEVFDDTPPVLDPTPPDTVVECDAVPEPPEVTATDNCAADETVAGAALISPGDCPGNYTITNRWAAWDDCGNMVEHVQVVDVVDTTPPAITPDESEAYCLWPPNHAMACFGSDDFSPEIVDNCSEPIEWRFVGCEPDAPDDGGDGNSDPDCVVAEDGQSFCVRAERSGQDQDGRRYLVTIEATDACGNTTLTPVGIGNILVPHSSNDASDCIKATKKP